MTMAIALQLLLAAGWLAAFGLLVLLLALELTMGRAPRLGATPAGASKGGKEANGRDILSVIVPAYNEATRINSCVGALLASELGGMNWRLVVADDDSSDSTVEGLEALIEAGAFPSPPLEVLRCGPRPAGERWSGKTLPCSEAVRLLPQRPTPDPDPAATEWLLFIDADVTVAPPALASAVAEARRSGADLLPLAPRIRCGCLAEWVVQPIVVALLGLGFPIARANNPDDPTAFAAGPFMLFRRSSYEAIGGHRALAAEVVEDLALARAIKQRGLSLRYLLGIDLLELRMYPDFGSLWEGWTKNWHLGLNRNPLLTLASGAVVLGLFSGPWLLLLLAGLQAIQLPLNWPSLLTPALVGVALQLAVRLWSRWRFGLGLRHWWLAWLGGLVIAAIAPVSIWKTSTGRGWTWRGRSLRPY
ncbi:glycosyltransferase family 2 protein [Synechococcus sp. EJ6-Ellesmere]|uniref:glycosyltransferase n=1 Tax=Synechococcus sp. EJ6-Ellesmere TaxID=2823734 RepID=UPI0020CCB60B|nr:glycosyltransferase family 2 protein [Synechococcus sp. EJ6-Ellesmere]MCP9826357.1 glycosyltransferase [Synechococcus sp. EJ6-Ellesmere]